MSKLILIISTLLCLDAPNLTPPSTKVETSESWLGIVIAKDQNLVMRVIPNSPADKVGLRTGDEIISLHSVSIKNATDIKKVLINRRPGHPLILKIKRAGQEHTAEMTVGKKPKRVPFPQYHTGRWSGPFNPEYDAIGVNGVGPVVFYFTASWCPPCKEIAKDVEKLYQDYKERITFIAVAAPNDFPKVIKLQEQGHYSFTVMEDLDLRSQLKIEVFPTFIIVTLDGDVTTRYEGINTSLTEDNTIGLIKKELDFLLAHPSENLILL